MPYMDAYIPKAVLSPRVERGLVAKLTDLLLEREGLDPANETARRMTWVWVYRPEVYVAGARPTSPRYRSAAQMHGEPRETAAEVLGERCRAKAERILAAADKGAVS